MRKSTAVLTSALFFFMGIVIGFAFAPIKNGLFIGNNSGNSNNHFADDCDDEYWEDEE